MKVPRSVVIILLVTLGASLINVTFGRMDGWRDVATTVAVSLVSEHVDEAPATLVRYVRNLAAALTSSALAANKPKCKRVGIRRNVSGAVCARQAPAL